MCGASWTPKAGAGTKPVLLTWADVITWHLWEIHQLFLVAFLIPGFCTDRQRAHTQVFLSSYSPQVEPPRCLEQRKKTQISVLLALAQGEEDSHLQGSSG